MRPVAPVAVAAAPAQGAGQDAGPLFSVVTVCRNAESTLARAAQSLVDQTYRDFEWVVVDGLSTDATVAVAESFAATLRASGVQDSAVVVG